MEVNNEDQRALIKVKMEVSLKNMQQLKLNNFKVDRDMRVLVDVEFKEKVREVY
jgi:hypothetical protein